MIGPDSEDGLRDPAAMDRKKALAVAAALALASARSRCCQRRSPKKLEYAAIRIGNVYVLPPGRKLGARRAAFERRSRRRAGARDGFLRSVLIHPGFHSQAHRRAGRSRVGF